MEAPRYPDIILVGHVRASAGNGRGVLTWGGVASIGQMMMVATVVGVELMLRTFLGSAYSGGFFPLFLVLCWFQDNGKVVNE